MILPRSTTIKRGNIRHYSPKETAVDSGDGVAYKQPMMITARIVLTGLGNLGLRFMRIVAEKHDEILARYGLDLRIVGAADSRGTAYAPNGLDPTEIVRVKEETGSIADYPIVGRRGGTALALIADADADVLCEATPVNLRSGGEPGLSCIKTALSRGMHVVTPNKGPIVLAYQELSALAAEHGVKLKFDGTVAGGLPALGIGTRELRGARISKIETVPNLVTGYVIALLAAGLEWDAALARARGTGALESDPSWDLDGWDAAAKLVILANAVLGASVRLEDVDRVGISGISPPEARVARNAGKRIRLLGTVEETPSGYHLRVAPQALSPGHPLGRLGEKEMGIVYYTDIYGTITTTIREETPVPSAATMLRDLLGIFSDER